MADCTRFLKYARMMRVLYIICDQHSELLCALQRCAVDKPLFPNLEWLQLASPTREFIPFIPFFLSPRTTTFDVSFESSDLPSVTIASMITAFPALCPNLREFSVESLPNNPIIAAAVSGISLANNWNNLQRLIADYPFPEEVLEVIFKLPNLRELLVVLEKGTSLPPVVLPNLTELFITYPHDHDWLEGLRGATLGKLTSVAFRANSESIGNFLEAFESVALATLTPTMLSTFKFYAPNSWAPNYRSLLPFTQLKELVINSPCLGGCWSVADDDIIADIAQAMPGLEILHLGHPCRTPVNGITATGFATLAHYCPHLSTLRVHFEVANLLDLPEIPGVPPGGKPTVPCALTELDVERILLPKEFVLGVSLTLLRIFPRIQSIKYHDERWREVDDMIFRSKLLADRKSKKPTVVLSRSKSDDTSPGTALGRTTRSRSAKPL